MVYSHVWCIFDVFQPQLISTFYFSRSYAVYRTLLYANSMLLDFKVIEAKLWFLSLAFKLSWAHLNNAAELSKRRVVVTGLLYLKPCQINTLSLIIRNVNIKVHFGSWIFDFEFVQIIIFQVISCQILFIKSIIFYFHVKFTKCTRSQITNIRMLQ